MPSAAANVLRRPTPCHQSPLLSPRHPPKLADLPIEPPMKYELVFHCQTALALGLTLPASLIEQADEVLG